MSMDGFFSYTENDPSLWLPKGIVDGTDDSTTVPFALPGGLSPPTETENSEVQEMARRAKMTSILPDEQSLLLGYAAQALVEQQTVANGGIGGTHAPAADELNGALTGRLRGPSGPRRAGQGVEEEEQQVASIEVMANGGLRLRVTLLAAGFVIGASGASIREIMRHTGSTIQSWTQPPEAGVYHRPCRVFCIQGNPESVMAASNLIHEAVERYKELCEGKRRGEFVQRLQYIRGVEFSYQPPPKNVVPNAASVNVSRTGNLTSPNAANETLQLLAAAQAQRDAMQHYQNLAASSYAAGLAAGAKMHQLNFNNMAQRTSVASIPNIPNVDNMQTFSSFYSPFVPPRSE